MRACEREKNKRESGDEGDDDRGKDYDVNTFDGLRLKNRAQACQRGVSTVWCSSSLEQRRLLDDGHENRDEIGWLTSTPTDTLNHVESEI